MQGQASRSGDCTRLLHLPADYRFIGRHSTPGNDIRCGQKDYKGNPQTFCKICDGIAALADACDNNPE